MRASVALPSETHSEAIRHLLREDGQEDLCFGLWYPSKGHDRFSGLVHNIVLPREGERQVHGNASFNSTYFERSLGEALSAESGLVFMHSHPGPGWQPMSYDDEVAESKLAPSVMGATGLPLMGMTVGTDGSWSARFWERAGTRKYERAWCESVRVSGDRFSVTFNDELIPVPKYREELSRTVSAWGARVQNQLMRLTVGIVGAGSVGSIVGESLARMGISRIVLLDFDNVENANLDRQLHATREDAANHEPKVDVLARGLRKSATSRSSTVLPSKWSVAEAEGYERALDCDLLFSCVDRPWPRSILNFIAYAHLIPVIDGGLAIRAKRGGEGLLRADWRAHVVAPTRRCLECLGQYDSGEVSADREGLLDDPSYITGLPEESPAKHNENVFAFSLSLASFEILQFIALVVAPLGLSNQGAQMYHFVPAILDTDREGCKTNCAFPSLLAKGDRTGMILTGRHILAEQRRSKFRVTSNR